jgi:hypothetical protein
VTARLAGSSLSVDSPGTTHLLAALVLLSRLGDVISTRLVTPRLALEANALARRLGWPFAWLTLLVAFVPYVHLGFGVAFLAASLLVTASNLSRVWVARALGESEYMEVVRRAARASRRSLALTCAWAAAAAILLLACVLTWLGGTNTWSAWVAFGIAGYGLAVGIHSTSFILRVHREAAAERAVV